MSKKQGFPQISHTELKKSEFHEFYYLLILKEITFFNIKNLFIFVEFSKSFPQKFTACEFLLYKPSLVRKKTRTKTKI